MHSQTRFFKSFELNANQDDSTKGGPMLRTLSARRAG